MTSSSEPPAARAPRLRGTVVAGEFVIEDQLGAGGMGTVYRATQRSTGRAVAIKAVHPHLLTDALAQRFEQETAALVRLAHPNVVTVFTQGTDADGHLYLVMELVDGVSLRKLLETEGRLTVDRALPLLVELVEGVAYAHSCQIVHRDLKPDNIMVARLLDRETVKILDFGLAKLMDGSQVRTITGRVMGSPPFMAPEQWEQRRDIDGRVDLYAVGCIAYLLLTGELPFRADTLMGFMHAHLGAAPADPTTLVPELADHPELLGTIRRCMARDRNGRPSSATELLDVLRRLDLARQLRHSDEVDVEAGPSDPVSGWGPMDTATLPPRAGGPWGPSSAPNPDETPEIEPAPSTGAAFDPPHAMATMSPDDPAPPRSLRWLWPLAVAAALVGGVSLGVPTLFAEEASPSAVVSPTSQNDEPLVVQETATESEPEPEPEPESKPESVSDPANAPSGSGSPPAQPAPDRSPALARVTLDSRPSGAVVEVAGAALGTTPRALVVSSGEAQQVTLRLEGHHDAEVTLRHADLAARDPSSPLVVDLEPVAPVKTPRATRRPKPRKTTTDAGKRKTAPASRATPVLQPPPID